MRVIVFTADEYNGAMMQYSVQMLSTCIELGHDATLMIPDEKRLSIPDGISPYVYRYNKVKDVFGMSPMIKETAVYINNQKPDTVIMCDAAILSFQVQKYIDKSVRRIITIHDVTPHPTNFTLRRYLVHRLAMFYRKVGFKNTDEVFLLSENSMNRFWKCYPRFNGKTTLFPLGAHPPKVIEIKSPDESIEKPYYLYFGRIEKYKGVDRLVAAYEKAESCDCNIPNLVIAGNGILDQAIVERIQNNDKIHLIKRFINDDEMVWLFTNCMIVVAPYIEASQSGVIPMAYHFGKPVLASNIEGLNEFVVSNETGYLFNTDTELESYLREIYVDFDDKLFAKNCFEYEKRKLNWQNNLEKVLEN